MLSEWAHKNYFLAPLQKHQPQARLWAGPYHTHRTAPATVTFQSHLESSQG